MFRQIRKSSYTYSAYYNTQYMYYIMKLWTGRIAEFVDVEFLLIMWQVSRNDRITQISCMFLYYRKCRGDWDLGAHW